MANSAIRRDLAEQVPFETRIQYSEDLEWSYRIRRLGKRIVFALEDELFLVLRGRLSIRLREQTIDLSEGEFFIVPRGVEHKPVAAGEAHVLLLEPSSTLNTGNVHSERTVIEPERM